MNGDAPQGATQTYKSLKQWIYSVKSRLKDHVMCNVIKPEYKINHFIDYECVFKALQCNMDSNNKNTITNSLLYRYACGIKHMQ